MIIPHNDGLGQHHFVEDPDGETAMPITNNDKNVQTTEKSFEEGALIVEKENEVATKNKPSIEVISDIYGLDDEKNTVNHEELFAHAGEEATVGRLTI